MADASSILHIRLGPSRQLALWLAAVHAGAVACAFASDLPQTLKWLLAAAVALNAARSIALHATARAARSAVHLTWYGDGRFRLTQRDGRVLDAVIERGTYVHPALVALVLRDARGRLHRVLVVPERTGVEAFRRLRVCLRCGGVPLC